MTDKEDLEKYTAKLEQINGLISKVRSNLENLARQKLQLTGIITYLEDKTQSEKQKKPKKPTKN